MTNEEISNAISAMAAKLLQESREQAMWEAVLELMPESGLDDDEYNYEPEWYGWSGGPA